MADHTAGAAAATLLPPGQIVLTAEFKNQPAARGERRAAHLPLHSAQAGNAAERCRIQVFCIASEPNAWWPRPRPPWRSLPHAGAEGPHNESLGMMRDRTPEKSRAALGRPPRRPLSGIDLGGTWNERHDLTRKRSSGGRPTAMPSPAPCGTGAAPVGPHEPRW